MIHLNMLREAEALYQQAASTSDGMGPTEARLEILEGELALTHGETAKGIALLEHFLPSADVALPTWLAYEDLAATYCKLGRVNDALRVLEPASRKNVWGFNGASAFQLRVKLQLAKLYGQLGRASDAAGVEAAIRKQLAFADPDHPILRALNR